MTYELFLPQASENVQLHFTPTYWPDIGFWDLFPIILDYQAKVWTTEKNSGHEYPLSFLVSIEFVVVVLSLITIRFM